MTLDRRSLIITGLGAGLIGCGGGDTNEPLQPTNLGKATGWTQMPSEFYLNIPEANQGSFPSVGGFSKFDLSDSTFLASIGWPTALPSPGDQGTQPSCTAWAVGFAAATATLRYSGQSLSSPISPADLFAKILRRTPGACTQGSYISTAMTALVEDGVTTLDLAPYFENQCGIASVQRAFNLDGFSRVPASDTVAIRGSVQSMQPVSFGMQVSSFFSQLPSSNPVFRPDGSGGGHAMTIVGYDDSRQLYKVINSWGNAWGFNGYFWISYADFANYARDVCVPFRRRNSDNALIAATTTAPSIPITANHLRASRYGSPAVGYGVGAELGWSAPLDVRSAAIEILNAGLTVLERKDFTVSQIARGLRFGTLIAPASASGLTQVRAAVTGYDSFGRLITITARTAPPSR